MGPRDVIDRDQGAVHPAAAVQLQPSVTQRVLHEGVDDEVVTHSRAGAVDSPLPEEHRVKISPGQRQQSLLGVVLRLGVGADRPHSRGLIVEHVGWQAIVDRAARTERQARDALAEAGFGQPFGGHGVHLPVGVRVVLRRRVVREPGHVHHGVHTVEDRIVHCADVTMDELDVFHALFDRPGAPEQPVEDAHLVPAFEQHADQDAADVAGAPGDENPCDGRSSSRGVRTARRAAVLYRTMGALRLSMSRRAGWPREAAGSCRRRGRETAPTSSGELSSQVR